MVVVRMIVTYKQFFELTEITNFLTDYIRFNLYTTLLDVKYFDPNNNDPTFCGNTYCAGMFNRLDTKEKYRLLSVCKLFLLAHIATALNDYYFFNRLRCLQQYYL